MKAYWEGIKVINIRGYESERGMVAIEVNSSSFPCWFWEKMDNIEVRAE